MPVDGPSATLRHESPSPVLQSSPARDEAPEASWDVAPTRVLPRKDGGHPIAEFIQSP
jgi:hypothetical protein